MVLQTAPVGHTQIKDERGLELYLDHEPYWA